MASKYDRTLIAARAMQSLIIAYYADADEEFAISPHHLRDLIVSEAVSYADALIKKLENDQTGVAG